MSATLASEQPVKLSKPARNHSLDFVKGIACMLVVCMHCEFPGYTGTFVQCVSRWAVPFFFMVSGYFCFRNGGKVNYAKKAWHIMTILAFAAVLYVAFELFCGHSLRVSKKELFNWVVFNEPVVIAGQLWFMFALLYDYILFGFIDRLGAVRLTKWLIPVCLVAYASLAYGAHFLGIKVPNFYYRNFLLEGLPLFSLICPEPCQQRRRRRTENLHKSSVRAICYSNAPADTPLQ